MEGLNKVKGFVTDKIAHMQKPEASLSSISFKNLSLDGINLQSEVSVVNPYSHRLPICEMSFVLKSDERDIATGKILHPGWIAASHTTKLEIPVKVRYDCLGSLMKDIAKDWDIDYEFDVELIIDLSVLGKFTIPLTIKGEIKLPTL